MDVHIEWENNLVLMLFRNRDFQGLLKYLFLFRAVRHEGQITNKMVFFGKYTYSLLLRRVLASDFVQDGHFI